jgi:hypothetical protein
MGVVDNFVHLFAPLTANCRDFSRLWENAPASAPDTVAGRWEGEWISTASGHRGRLRCVVELLGPTTWRLWFRAEYAGIFRACYSTDVSATHQADHWTFCGGSDLGALAGGRYSYEGSTTVTEFRSTYRSARDHGEFRLKKLAPRPSDEKRG